MKPLKKFGSIFQINVFHSRQIHFDFVIFNNNKALNTNHSYSLLCLLNIVITFNVFNLP